MKLNAIKALIILNVKAKILYPVNSFMKRLDYLTNEIARTHYLSVVDEKIRSDIIFKK